MVLCQIPTISPSNPGVGEWGMSLIGALLPSCIQLGHAVGVHVQTCTFCCLFSLIIIVGLLVENTDAECACGAVDRVHASLHLTLTDYIATTTTTGGRVGAGIGVIGHLVQIHGC